MRRKQILSICFVIMPFLAACSGLPKTGGDGPQQVSVTVTPATPTVNNFATQQFTAAVTGTTNTAVTWQVNTVAGGSQATGFISSSGLFVAPGAVPTKSDGSGNSVPTTVKVTAVSQANVSASNSATVTIVPQNQNAQSGAIKLESDPGTKIDAAIAQIVTGKVDPLGNILCLGATATNGIPDPGQVHAGSGVAATVGMQVAKSGRTTGLTCSSVLSINFSTTVTYTKGCGKSTTFPVTYPSLVQVLGGNFSSEGDSGSLIVTQNNADAVALLFAGSDQDVVGNAISDVLNSSKFLGAGNAVPTVVGSSTPHAVIGCTLPAKPAGAIQTLAASAVTSEALQNATAARDAH